MESQSRLLDLQQAFQTEPNFDKYAQRILENSKTIAATATATGTATATIANRTYQPTKITEFLQEFGATFINSIQNQNIEKSLHINHSPSFGDQISDAQTDASAFDFNSSSILAALSSTNYTNNNLNLNQNHNNSNEMEIEFIPNHIIIDSSSFETMEELQKQLEYDKFMNEVWIGIVLTLILISMIFCICSCFLYHQFRTWKRNYHSTVVQVHSADIESLKFDDLDDPLPEYTLVSGLPSYEAALELLQKSPQKSCLLVYPSIFNVFNKNECTTTPQFHDSTTANNAATTRTTTTTVAAAANLQQEPHHIIDITTPLLSNTPSSMTMTATAVYPKHSETNSDNSNNNNNSINNNNNTNTIVISSDLSGNFRNNTTVSEKELLEFITESNAMTRNGTILLHEEEEGLIIKNETKGRKERKGK